MDMARAPEVRPVATRVATLAAATLETVAGAAARDRARTRSRTLVHRLGLRTAPKETGVNLARRRAGAVHTTSDRSSEDGGEEGPRAAKMMTCAPNGVRYSSPNIISARREEAAEREREGEMGTGARSL